MAKYKSKSPRETQKIAVKLAKKILSRKVSKKAIALALEGELGAGKTVFTQGFAKALGIKQKITSPTFVLMKRYSIPTSGQSLVASRHLYHIDAYRLKDHRDLEALGVRELIKGPQNILIIEWSDRIAKILPKRYIKVHIDHIDKATRKITIPS